MILDTAKFCPKCGANVQDVSSDSKAASESPSSAGSGSGRSIPPPPPGRSTTGSVYSQQAVSGSNGKNDSYGYQAKSSQNKSKDDSSVGKMLLKLFAVTFGIVVMVIVLGIIFASSDSDDVGNASQQQTQASPASENGSVAPQSESRSSNDSIQQDATIVPPDAADNQAEESKRAAELELAKAKEAAAEAEWTLIQERRRAADELSAKAIAEQNIQAAVCPYNDATPLLCESRKDLPVSCTWDYAACGAPRIQKKLSRSSCDYKVSLDIDNQRITVTDGCRAQFVPENN
jgi:hypothetical protein